MESDERAHGAGEAERLAKLLGLVSLGLGAASLAAPGSVARLIGVEEDDGIRGLLRAIGIRELASGVGILASARPTEWVWARVGGDAMDLALLGAALNGGRAQQERVLAAGAAIAGIAALDLKCATALSGAGDGHRGHAAGERDIVIKRAITINRPPAEVYRFWRDFRNLPRFMRHLESVEIRDERRSRWTATGPAGRTVSWDAEIVADEPNRRISWRSLGEADVENHGTVRFDPAPRDRGTEVRVDLHYAPPAGFLGATVAMLFGEEPNRQMQEDLPRLKQVLETGEVVVSDATVHGSKLIGQHPAQPPAEAPSGVPSAD